MKFRIRPKVSCWHPLKGSAEYLHEEPFIVDIENPFTWTEVIYAQVMWDAAQMQHVVRLDTVTASPELTHAVAYPDAYPLRHVGVVKFDFSLGRKL